MVFLPMLFSAFLHCASNRRTIICADIIGHICVCSNDRALNDMFQMFMVPNIFLKHDVTTKHVSVIWSTGLVIK